MSSPVRLSPSPRSFFSLAYLLTTLVNAGKPFVSPPSWVLMVLAKVDRSARE